MEYYTNASLIIIIARRITDVTPLSSTSSFFWWVCSGFDGGMFVSISDFIPFYLIKFLNKGFLAFCVNKCFP